MRMKSRFDKDDNYLTLVLIHIALGIVFYFLESLSKLFFVAMMLYFLWNIIICHTNKKVYHVLLACAYFTGGEILFRMTNAGIAYEASKYLVILFVLMGMFYKGISGKGYPYFIYLILLVPAIIVASSTLSWGVNFRTNIAFVLSGPVSLGLATLFCYDRKIAHKDLLQILLYIMLPCISLTVYLFLYTPSIKEVLTSTASNSATSGGFGPNQVATILGLGMFCVVVRLFLKSPTIGLKIVNVIILVAMSFRAIVTFSRGGIIAAGIMIAAFLWVVYNKATYKIKNQIIGTSLLFLFAGILTWTISSNQTSGLIDKRYANQDALGREKEDLATGRVDLLMEEIDGFLSAPFLGIGASRVKDIRVERDGKELPSHNEIGRLLSEHGFVGIIIILILIIKPLGYRTSNTKNLYFYAFLAFWFGTINHSGMRIAAPSLLYALALVNVTYEKNSIHRQQLKK